MGKTCWEVKVKQKLRKTQKVRNDCFIDPIVWICFDFGNRCARNESVGIGKVDRNNANEYQPNVKEWNLAKATAMLNITHPLRYKKTHRFKWQKNETKIALKTSKKRHEISIM